MERHKHINELLTTKEIISAREEALTKYPNLNLDDKFEKLFSEYVSINVRSKTIQYDLEVKICKTLGYMVNTGYSKQCIKVYNTIYTALKEIQDQKDEHSNYEQ